jgi:hypothetical protein
MVAISCTGSTAFEEVVPIVAHTITGVRSDLRSVSIAAARADGFMRSR